jgi:hypothetical protein
MVNNLQLMRGNSEPLAAARATAVLESHLRIHLNKEDIHLYPLLEQGTTDSEQLAIVQKMSTKVPAEKFPILVQWLIPLLDFDDRVVIIESWMKMMPPPVFYKLKPMIRKLTGQEWNALTQQIPQLDEK